MGRGRAKGGGAPSVPCGGPRAASPARRRVVTRSGAALAKALLGLLAATCASAAADAPLQLAGHTAVFDAQQRLRPWAPFGVALDREMAFYASAPLDHGYPIFITTTFLDGAWLPQSDRADTIPATQNGMGILSYLKYDAWRHHADPHTLAIARAMGDYLVDQANTPDTGAWPRFTRSTGVRGQFPLAADAGSQKDGPFEIEPDKGGIAGYALLQLYGATRVERYRRQALHDARLLAAHQQPGDATHSPFPFRVDYRSGAIHGAISGNMVYVLRLYDGLIAQGHAEFAKPRAQLWAWIRDRQIPSAAGNGRLFAQFFEDHSNRANRSAWAPLNLARYLIERREALDPQWREHAQVLITFVRNTFTHIEAGVRVCHEQDLDHDAWGGINSTYGAVLAMYAKATGDTALAEEAHAALTFSLYAIDADGRPRDLPRHTQPGGWQEDAHTDVVHNIVDALQAFPEWAGQ